MANNWAIAVGINHYEFLSEASLSFAAQDALAMRQFLCAEAGFQEKQVLLCGDSPEGTRKATRPVLRDILLNKLEHAKNADNLWFFFGGHGGVGSDRQDYLLTSDSNPQDLHDTAIPINFVTDRLRACKAKNIVLVLDMCRSERLQKGERGLESMEDSVRQLVKDREGQQGIITLFSCGRGQSSYEIAELQQGAFTYALLEGLRQHSILKDLEKFLEKRVPELHQLHRAAGQTRRQVPLVISEPAWKYDEPILSHYATAVDVSRLKEMAIDAECDLDFEKALRLWEQVIVLPTINTADRERALNRIRDLDKGSLHSPVRPEPPTPSSPLQSTELKQSSVQPLSNVAPVALTQHPVDTIALESEREVDYRKLKKLLATGRWQEADQETTQRMCEAMNRQKEGWLRQEDIENFPCVDLRTIDQLWVKYSKGKFGFSVQKKIWEECGTPIEFGFDPIEFEFENWEEFVRRIGWIGEDRLWKRWRKLNFSPDFSPRGELPTLWVKWWSVWGVFGGSLGWRSVSSLAQRLVNCSTTQPYLPVSQPLVQPLSLLTHEPSQGIDAVTLKSEKGVDYGNLRDLLKAGKWRESDQETRKVMLKAANRESEGWLDADSLKNFPCQDLKTIDHLWVTASNGHFGFSIQKKIWEESGAPMSYGDWDLFGDLVGWRQKGNWLSYTKLKFSLEFSQKGELPILVEIRFLALDFLEDRRSGGSLFNRKDL